MAVKALTPEQMVAPKAIAPFEAALAFALWSERYQDDLPKARHYGLGELETFAKECCGGLGAPFRGANERPKDYGERCALALFTLIKEI